MNEQKKCINIKFNPYCAYAYGTRCDAHDEQYKFCKRLGIDKEEADKKFAEKINRGDYNG